MTKKNYFLSDSFHSENDAKPNSFLLDPKEICDRINILDSRLRGNDSGGCKENSDGSIDLELTLYFKPQSYFYLGLIISGTTLVGCLVYLAYDWKKRRKMPKESQN